MSFLRSNRCGDPDAPTNHKILVFCFILSLQLNRMCCLCNVCPCNVRLCNVRPCNVHLYNVRPCNVRPCNVCPVMCVSAIGTLSQIVQPTSSATPIFALRAPVKCCMMTVTLYTEFEPTFTTFVFLSYIIFICSISYATCYLRS